MNPQSKTGSEGEACSLYPDILNIALVQVLNAPRPGKKLLVADIDYTIFDLNSSAERAEELARPFLHQFFAAAYADYDIVIWR